MPYTLPKLTDFSPASLDRAVQDVLSALESESQTVSTENAAKEFRDRWMARKNGILTQANDGLKAAPADAKRNVGQRVNEIKASVEAAVEAAQQRIQGGSAAAALESERVDVTLPGIRRPLGAEHPVIRTLNETGLLRRRRPRS